MRVSVIVLTGVVLSAFVSGSTMTSSLGEASHSLSSSDYLEATEATRILFDAGEASIPLLVANLSDASVFSGLCGNQIRQSHADLLPVESLGNSVEGSNAEDGAAVREVSLYLILAILKDDLYFAESCKPGIKETHNQQALQLASGEIAILFVRSQVSMCEFSLDSVERILRKHGICFQ